MTLPENLGVDQNGKEVRLSDFAYKKLILYFYPKDSTPGCTSEYTIFATTTRPSQKRAMLWWA